MDMEFLEKKGWMIFTIKQIIRKQWQEEIKNDGWKSLFR